MKRTAAIVLAAALLAALAPAGAQAHDRGWAAVGKVLTGVIGLSILSHAIAHPYPAPAAVYAPPPAPPEWVWVPGHYAVRIERRWIPAHWEIDRPGRYGDDDDWYDDGDHGRRDRRAWVPGHYRDVEVRVWIPGHWEERG